MTKVRTELIIVFWNYSSSGLARIISIYEF